MGKVHGLKINKESHLIKKSLSVNKAQQRPPVIIYTHSPKVIQTHARNFMELVQKLTGLYRADPEPEDANVAALKPPTPPRKEKPKANEAPSPEEVESSCCNCVAPLIPDYNNANNYAIFESDFNKPLFESDFNKPLFESDFNKPLLTFADPSCFIPEMR